MNCRFCKNFKEEFSKYSTSYKYCNVHSYCFPHAQACTSYRQIFPFSLLSRANTLDYKDVKLSSDDVLADIKFPATWECAE